MTKKCLTYIKKENQNFLDSLPDLLGTMSLDFVYANDFKDIKDKSEDGHSDNFVLIISDIDESYFDFTFSSKFINAVIIWINEGATSKHDENNGIYAFETFYEAQEFLKQIDNGQIPLEFKERVCLQDQEEKQKKSEHGVNKDNLIENQENQLNNEKESKSEGVAPEKIVTVTTKDLKQESITDQKRNFHARELQKQLFSPYQRTNHKMIGVWSPVHSSGVTTIVFNFALFLAKHRIDIAVIEGVGNAEHILKEEWLERYTNVPTNWISYAKALQTEDLTNKNVNWIYKDVKYFPFDREDKLINWDKSLLELYMTTTKMVDVTIVDYSTGELSSLNRQSLSYLDELWIVGDHRYLTYYSWKNYICQLKDHFNLPIHLIMNQTYEASPSIQFSKDLSVPLLASIPSIHEAISLSHLGKTPLYEMEIMDSSTEQPISVAELLNPAFYVMAKHLLNGELIKVPQDPSRTTFKNIWMKWIRRG